MGAGDLELRRIEFLKLLRQVPEVTDVALIGADGREQIAESRLGMSLLGSGKDRSAEPAFQQARRGQPWYGPVYFRKETEPYMSVAVRSGGDRLAADGGRAEPEVHVGRGLGASRSATRARPTWSTATATWWPTRTSAWCCARHSWARWSMSGR